MSPPIVIDKQKLLFNHLAVQNKSFIFVESKEVQAS